MLLSSLGLSSRSNCFVRCYREVTSTQLLPAHVHVPKTSKSCQALVPARTEHHIRFPDLGTKEKNVGRMSCVIVNTMSMNESNDSFNMSR